MSSYHVRGTFTFNQSTYSSLFLLPFLIHISFMLIFNWFNLGKYNNFFLYSLTPKQFREDTSQLKTKNNQENLHFQKQNKSYTHFTSTQTIFCMFVPSDRGNSSSYSSFYSFTLFSPFHMVFPLPALGNKNHKKGTIQNTLFVFNFYIHPLLFICILLMFLVFFTWIHEYGGT